MNNSEPKQYIDTEYLTLFREVFWKKCKAHGIVLEDLVDRTELSYIQIYRIVRGTKNTSLSNVIAVIRAAGFQPSEILNFTISIPEYAPLRSEMTNNLGKKIRKVPGASFFIKQYIENDLFKGNGLTSVELTNLVNNDLVMDFTESDFSSELGRFYDKNILSRRKEGNSYKYYQV